MGKRQRPGRGISTRAYILGELRKEPGAWVRGESLASPLGLSRVAVWKGIQSLIAAGYPIRGAGSGYRLAGETDLLYPWEFGEREGLFRWFDRTASTMDRAREYAEAFPPAPGPFMVFTAETQSSGRGRGGRNWVSSQGGLFFTVLERPALALADYSLFSMRAQIAALRTVEALTGKEARLRWPNDVYAGTGKIAGVLTELSGEGDRLRWIAAGLGININNVPPAPSGLSCAELAGRRLSRREGLGLFLEELEKLRATGPGELRDAWNSRAAGIGSPVIVIGPGHDGDKDPRRTAVLGRGIFAGVDHRFRCRVLPEAAPGNALPERSPQKRSGRIRAGAEAAVQTLYSPGAASLIYRGLI